MAKYNDKGEEIPDDTPVEMPLGFTRPLTIEERIARAIRGHISQMAADEGFETFEEANDFTEEGEDEMPVSEHELNAEIDEDTMSHLRKLEQERRDEEFHQRLQGAHRGRTEKAGVRREGAASDRGSNSGDDGRAGTAVGKESERPAGGNAEAADRGTAGVARQDRAGVK